MATVITASDHQADVAVIGAGVVGCAVARRLALAGHRVIVLEKAADILDGASKGNSGILHTGFDAPPDTIEQRLVAEGHAEYLAIRERLGLPLLETGALVLAWTPAEEARLDDLIAVARQNGVDDVRRLTRAEILAREPALSPAVIGGFLVPREYVIDPWSAPHAYLLQAIAHGATLVRRAEVTTGNFDGSAWHLETTAGRVKATAVVAAAGLYGDVVDSRLLGETSFEIRPRKGQFVVYDKRAAKLVSSIILPVPTPTTKGVVLCPTAFGNLLVGPTAEEQPARDRAEVDEATLAMLAETGARLVPALAGMDVTAVYAGLRPATERKEYRIGIHADRNYLSLGGIRSTGLSAALGLAGLAAEKIAGFGLAPKAIEPAATIWPKVQPIAEMTERAWTSPGHGGIVCHCELVTRHEIEAAFADPLAPASMAGLKRRTRATMGRCQGFYCLAHLQALTADRLGAAPTATGGDCP